jgi:hypothetical protein
MDLLQLLILEQKELAVNEIKGIEKKYAQAAIHAKAFGYDGIEIHGFISFFFILLYLLKAAHGYTLS